jgi:hypothetical protein
MLQKLDYLIYVSHMEALLKALKLITIVLALISSVTIAHAQATQPPDCTFDLTEANALMTQAQTKASGGDIPGALALLDQAKQKITEIETRCGATLTPAPSENYTEPSGAFSIKYPKGWLTQALADTPAEQANGAGPILFANEPSAFDVIADSKASTTAKGVVVYLGTSQQIMKQLSVSGVRKTVDPLNAINLLNTIVMGQSSTSDGKFGTPAQGAAINDHATAEVPFSFLNDSSAPVADGNVLLVQLAPDQFAVLVSFASPGQGQSIAALARSMAATLNAPAKPS